MSYSLTIFDVHVTLHVMSGTSCNFNGRIYCIGISSHTCADPEGRQGVLTTPAPGKLLIYRFLSNTGQDPLKIQATNPAFNFGPSLAR